MVVGANIEFLEQSADIGLHVGGRIDIESSCAAHADYAVEQALCLGHGKQDQDFGPAARLAKDRYAVGIAPEGGDVVTHPLQRGYDIQMTGVLRVAVRVGG